MSRERRFVRTADLGHGRAVLDRAGRALLGRRMHEEAGITVEGPDLVVVPPAAPGLRVLLRPRTGPAAWLRLTAPCEVADVVDEPDRRGFTYRTLPGHPERGTETFLVERDPAKDRVTARITASSRPGTLLVRLAGPVSRPTRQPANRPSTRAGEGRSGRTRARPANRGCRRP